MLKEFGEENESEILNSFFKNRMTRKLTRISPNGNVKKELEFDAINITLGKVYGKLLPNRLYGQINERFPKGQAGFCPGFSNYGNILYLSFIFQKTREYNFGITLIFVDFLKAFDSVSLKKLFQELGSLEDKGCVDMLKKLNLKTSLTSQLLTGDTSSSIIFSMLVAKVAKNLGWDEANCKYGVNGEKLAYFVYADGSAWPRQSNANSLGRKVLKVELKINYSKTNTSQL
uniref:Reverse transcriptase domain-containing protein n=1 Tax=Rhabditophanes sp. KR3021 TaxID=114890 RepID=A0AC35UBM9_9BILA